jgi:hypothetical protein
MDDLNIHIESLVIDDGMALDAVAVAIRERVSEPFDSGLASEVGRAVARSLSPLLSTHQREQS